MLEKVTLSEAFKQFDEVWSPRIGGDINDCQLKLAKFEGAFDWHRHDNEDELFLVVSGKLRMRLRDGDVHLGPGEYIIVPRGVEHCPVAEPTCNVVLLEPSTTLNTGNVENDRTVRSPKRIA
ncbi:MAG: cupin domain-containing protein [Pseudomonadota bacterium]